MYLLTVQYPGKSVSHNNPTTLNSTTGRLTFLWGGGNPTTTDNTPEFHARASDSHGHATSTGTHPPSHHTLHTTMRRRQCHVVTAHRQKQPSSLVSVTCSSELPPAHPPLQTTRTAPRVAKRAATLRAAPIQPSNHPLYITSRLRLSPSSSLRDRLANTSAIIDRDGRRDRVRLGVWDVRRADRA